VKTWTLPSGQLVVQLGGDSDGKGGVVLVVPKGTDLERYIAQSYVKRLKALADAVKPKPGELLQADVKHEAWCPVLVGAGLCRCEPRVQLRVIRGGGHG